MPSPRALSVSVAVGRVVIGASLVAAPAATGRRWLGAAAETPGGGVAVRAMGARDFTLGVMTLLALHGDNALGPALVGGGALCDLADGGALLAARRDMPPAGVATGVLAVALAAVGAGLAGALRG